MKLMNTRQLLASVLVVVQETVKPTDKPETDILIARFVCNDCYWNKKLKKCEDPKEHLTDDQWDEYKWNYHPARLELAVKSLDLIVSGMYWGKFTTEGTGS